MKKLMMMIALAACAVAMTGCMGTSGKVRDVDLKGMYVNGYSEVVAIGRGKLTSIPSDKEALAAHYEEDTAWLSPSTKTHALDIFMVGSNTVANSTTIIESICKAFAEVAPAVSSNNAEVAKAGGTSPLDVVKAGGSVRQAVQTAKATATQAASAATAKAAEQSAAGCTGDNCTAGNCTACEATPSSTR